MTWWTRSGGTLGSRGLRRRDPQPAEMLPRTDGEDEKDPQPVLPPGAVPRHWSRTPHG